MENHSDPFQENSSDMQENQEKNQFSQFDLKHFNNKKAVLYRIIFNGDKKGKASYSPNVELMTGYSPEEIEKLPRKGLSLVLEEDLDQVKKILDELADDKSKDILDINYRISKKDNEVIWINESSSVFRNEEGEVKEIKGVLSDITELKKKQTELADQINEINRSNQTKDGFISMLSHDLRAPFTSILGFCDILLNEPNLTRAETTEYLNFIHQSSQTNLQLINYLLDWSKLQTGKQAIEPNRLNVQSVIYENVSALTGMAIRKNINIKVDVDPALHINADERLMEQVLNNLISNAVKFSREGSRVDIYAGTFNDDFIEFVVKDEGVGISEMNKKKLFKIDKMFSTEGTKGERGTGLGLTLSKEIIEKHGGKMWYYSETGKGSEFHFTIPSAVDTIIIISDDQEDLDNFKEIVQENYPDYQILGTNNSYHAIEVILQKTPSLIITSHEMPLMTGLQMMQLIKSQDDSFSTPIIAFSNYFTDELKDAYNKYGISNLVEKPVDKEMFTQSLHSILN